MAKLKTNSVGHVGAALYALSFAVLTTLAIRQFDPGLGIRSVLAILVGFCVAFFFLWEWIFFERRNELDKKLPVGSKELRRRKQEFFDTPPR
jgi:putative flippase GtrA